MGRSPTGIFRRNRLNILPLCFAPPLIIKNAPIQKITFAQPFSHKENAEICLCFVHLLSAIIVSILLVYPYLSAMALCSGHSAHRQLQCCSRKANLSCLPVNIIVTDTPTIPSHRMNDPSVALKNGHPTSTLSQLVAIDYPPKLLAF